MKNYGKRNEYDFIYKLNNKKIKDVDYLLRDMIETMFNDIDANDVIECYKLFEYEKPDICIKIKDQEKYISIKKDRRDLIQIKWYNLEDNIIEIMNQKIMLN